MCVLPPLRATNQDGGLVLLTERLGGPEVRASRRVPEGDASRMEVERRLGRRDVADDGAV